MTHDWEFAQAQPRGWIWRCVDKSTGSVARMSDRVFPLLYDCVEDAKGHGFVPSPVRAAAAASPGAAAPLTPGVPPASAP